MKEKMFFLIVAFSILDENDRAVYLFFSSFFNTSARYSY